jgi:hypothetical protein
MAKVKNNKAGNQQAIERSTGGTAIGDVTNIGAGSASNRLRPFLYRSKSRKGNKRRKNSP